MDLRSATGTWFLLVITLSFTLHHGGGSVEALTTSQLMLKISSQLEGDGGLLSKVDVRWMLKRLRMKDCKEEEEEEHEGLDEHGM